MTDSPTLKTLRSRLEKLESLSATLEPSQEERQLLWEKVNTLAQGFLQNIGTQNGFYDKTPQIFETIDQEPQSLDTALEEFEKKVLKTGISPASEGHLGYIPGGGIYASALGDYLAAVSNEYAGMYFASPGAVDMENVCLDWLKQVFNYPKDSVGNLSSGGSIANLIALTAARDHHKIEGKQIERSVLYTSKQVHHCIHKALRIIGLKDVIFRELQLDERHRIDAEDLEKQIQLDKSNGLNPFLVIASAGTTDTGAVDPLEAISNICSENKLWYHIDGAYGGFFAMVESKKDLFRGIEKSDSLVIDPHKGLFMPYGIGAVLVKNKKAVMKSQHYIANYMQDAIDENMPTNPADVSPELTKHFRGMRMWLPLKIHGIQPFVDCLEEKILLTHYFRLRLSEIGFELGPEPDLSVSYFWWDKGTDSNEYNRELLKEIHKDGRVFLSSTMLDGKFVIRMAILAFRTKTSTIDRAIEMILKCKDVLDRNWQLCKSNV